MVAIIKTGHSLNRILNYNEQKVKEGKAVCIAAINYPIEAENLSIKNKLNRLIKQAALNENVSRNSVHISLNFDPSEKIATADLKDVADTYMQKVGFGNQPYLVYEHTDAGHPHIHVVSVKVRPDGSRIDTQNIGRNQSEKARKEIEISFGLVKAEDSKKRQAYALKPVNVQKVQYGRAETKRAITNVLDVVLNTYKFTSLPELNAVLQQYNVLADRGSENSRIFQNNGLVYRITDSNGNKAGVPIKASDFYNKPTLAFLESKFALNGAARQPHKVRVRNAIDLALIRNKNPSFESLIKSLEKEAIHTVLRTNNQGLLYGISYVDHKTKCVFNGSDLGKQYSAKGILERCNQGESLKQNYAHEQEQISNQNAPLIKVSEQAAQPTPHTILEDLIQPIETNNYIPHQLKKAKKKRKNL